MPDPPVKYLRNGKLDVIHRIFPTTFNSKKYIPPRNQFLNSHVKTPNILLTPYIWIRYRVFPYGHTRFPISAHDSQSKFTIFHLKNFCFKKFGTNSTASRWPNRRSVACTKSNIEQVSVRSLAPALWGRTWYCTYWMNMQNNCYFIQLWNFAKTLFDMQITHLFSTVVCSICRFVWQQCLRAMFSTKK